jgi:hypothetical protein
MEQFLKNQQIPLVQVIDPATGQQYYVPEATVYDDRNGPNPTFLKSVIVDSASYATTASYALNGGSGGSGSADTGSLLTTASFLNPNLTFEKGDKTTFSVNLISLIPNTSSFSLTASYIDGGTF